jgi:hypothetical protein
MRRLSVPSTIPYNAYIAALSASSNQHAANGSAFRVGVSEIGHQQSTPDSDQLDTARRVNEASQFPTALGPVHGEGGNQNCRLDSSSSSSATATTTVTNMTQIASNSNPITAFRTQYVFFSFFISTSSCKVNTNLTCSTQCLSFHFCFISFQSGMV